MRKKFWIIWLLCALAAGALIGLYQYTAYQSIRSNAIAHLQQLADAKQTALQGQLSKAIGSLHEAVAFASSANPPTGHVEAINQAFARLIQKNPSVITLLMINADGQSVASNRPTLIGSNFKNSPRYKTISEHPDPNRIFISEPFLTPLGNYTIALGAMLPNAQGAFGGYVLAIAAPAPFADTLAQGTAEYNTASALIHDNGFVIFRVPDNDDREASDLRAYPDSAFWKFLNSGATQYLDTASVPSTGRQNIVAYRQIAFNELATDHRLFLGLSIETDDLFAEWLKLGLELFGAWVLLVGLGGLFMAWKTQRLDV